MSSPTPTIVLFLPQEWADYVRRPHWEAIARRAEVLAVEPPVGLLTFWRHPGRLREYLRQGRKVRRITDRLNLWRPLSFASIGLGFRLPLIAKIDRWWIGRQLRNVLASTEPPGRTTISFVVKVQQYYLRDILPAVLRCYEVTDEYRVLTGDDHVDFDAPHTSRMARYERAILAEVDLVIASSEKLRESRAKQNANTHYLPNCVDYRHFAVAAEPGGELPSDLAAIAGPRLGYVGGFNDLIDLELMTRLAREKSDAALIIIGEERGTREFRQGDLYRTFGALPNVHFLGHRRYETLPAYLRGFDVCLLPFRLNEWMRNSSPNKIYQYLAAGKPVVSTDFPEARRVSSVVQVASGHDQFLAMVGDALASDNEQKIAGRQEVARANSTDVRAEAVLELIARTLAAKPANDLPA